MRTQAKERIVVRSLNWLGDAVMSTPALQRLREAKPEAHIALLCPEKLAGLWQAQPYLDETLTFSKQETLWQVSRRLREGRFDIGLAFPNSVRSALELWLGRIPLRVGYARPWRTLFLSKPVPPRAEAVAMHKRSDAEIQRLVQAPQARSPIASAAHHVFDYLGLVGALGASSEACAPLISVSQAEVEEVRRRFGMGGAKGPLVGVNPGAEYGPAKRWPAGYFAAAAREIQKQVACSWVIFGGGGDSAVAAEIARELEGVAGQGAVFDLAGKTSLRELTAALKACRLLLTNDTGPMHVAAALGTPVVVPFGSTSPELTGPRFSKAARVLQADAPCAPCFRRECPLDLRCLKGITPAMVAGAALDVLRG